MPIKSIPSVQRLNPFVTKRLCSVRKLQDLFSLTRLLYQPRSAQGVTKKMMESTSTSQEANICGIQLNVMLLIRVFTIPMRKIFTQTAQPFLRPQTKDGILVAVTLPLVGAVAGR